MVTERTANEHKIQNEIKANKKEKTPGMEMHSIQTTVLQQIWSDRGARTVGSTVANI